jgi:hypothetical protein
MLTYSQINNIPIAGRLGNNMWEISSTIGIGMKHGIETYFPKWRYNQYFNYGVPEGYPKGTMYILQETTSAGYQEFDLNYAVNYDLRGYFQAWRYFEHCKEYIKQLFTFNFETNEIESDRVAVHVRRGDYLGSTWLYNILTPENYYGKAMDYFPRGTQFSIFSDDIEWCKTQFNHDNCTFVIEPTIKTDIPRDILDMAYMSRHKHHIISNSSYSWWAGYLGEDNGVVIAPQHWYVNGYDERDICPPDWIRI